MLLLLFAQRCHSQTSNYINYRFQRLTTADGLPNENVTAIFKDRDGFMWFGTQGGLCRYDGQQFKIYRSEFGKKNSLPENWISAINQDEEGNLWVGTNQQGMCIIDLKTDSIQSYSKDNAVTFPLAGTTVKDFFFDSKGRKWMGTFGGGIIEMTARSEFHSYHFDENAIDQNYSFNTVTQIEEDTDGWFWLTTHKGLIRFNPATKQFFKYAFDIEGNNPQFGSMSFDGNKIWLGSYSYGVVEFDKQQKTFSNYTFNADKIARPGSKDVVMDIEKKSSDELWLVTEVGLGIFNTRSHRFYFFETNSSRPFSAPAPKGGGISKIYDGSDGVWWFTVEGNLIKLDLGLQYFSFHPLVAHSYHYEPYFKSNAFYFDVTSQSLFVAAHQGDGLYELNNDTVITYDYKRKTSVSVIRNIVALSQTQLLVPTIDGMKIFSLPERRFLELPEKFPLRNQLSKTDIGIIDDEDNCFWFQMDDTLYSIQKESWSVEKFYNNRGLQYPFFSEPVSCVLKDAAGNYLFGSFEYGICRVDVATGKREVILPLEGKKPELGQQHVRDMVQDRNGNYWVAMWLETLVRIKSDGQGNFSREYFSSNIGLNATLIQNMVKDAEENLWLATNDGLYRVNPATLSVSRFDELHGLPYSSLIEDLYASPDGKMYLTSHAGYVSFDPSQIKSQGEKPKLLLSKFTVFDRTISSGYALQQTKKLSLKYSENYFSFEFSALAYRGADNIQYSFMLEGVDKDRITGKRNFASYTNVSPGNYLFKVKAGSSDGIWSDEVSIPIHIITPFFMTWWFYLLCTLAFAGIVYSIYRIRLDRLLALQRIRNKIATDLHDDVGSTLSSINMLTRLAQSKTGTDQPRVKQLLEKIRSSSENMMENMSDIVWSINAENDLVENLVVRMKEFAADILESKNIDFIFTADESLMKTKLPLSIRRDFYLIYKEAINNLAKYSECSHAEIKIFSETPRSFHGNSLLILRVADDGKGFDAEKSFSGNGLKNYKIRSEKINAQFEIRSSIGNGTEVILKVPMNQSHHTIM
jgi:ligand-binding sensor domain-containing protein/two-component sensor histidine kinase